MKSMVLFDFSAKTDANSWNVVNDGVMGGLSEGHFVVNTAGHGYFHGEVSLENNGGFSSVRHAFNTKDVTEYTQIELRIKGDGKAYQFRVKSEDDQRYSHIANITTSGEWETVHIPFSEMYPAFRGRVLDLPNYPGETLAEITFLIGNKKAESFALEIDYIALE